MKLCATITGDDKGKEVRKTANEYLTIQLYVQDGADKENFVGEIELQYRDDVKEFGGPDSKEEFKPDMNEWLILYRPRIDEYTDWQDVYQGHVYPATNKTADRKR